MKTWIRVLGIGLAGLALVALALAVLPEAGPAEASGLAAPLEQGARSVITVTQIARAGGTTMTLVAADSDGNYFRNSQREFLVAKNSSGATITVTVQTPGTVDGLAIDELEVAVGAGVTKFIGPFPSATYNQSGVNANRVFVDYSGVTSLTVGVFQLVK